MKTFTLTTNNAKTIEEFAYMIERQDGLILYANRNYDYVYREFCEIALYYQQKGELANFIIR